MSNDLYKYRTSEMLTQVASMVRYGATVGHQDAW
jgi:hypothetical protein